MDICKKLLVLLLALTMVLCFAACGDEPEETEPTLNKGDKNCEHVWTEWEITKENTCAKNGRQERECEKCGKQEEEELLAFGHAYFDGVCSECGKEAKECEHPELYTVVESEASCTEDGVERRVCKLCRAVVSYNYIDAFWHREVDTVVISEPTCTEDGLKQDICKLCGEVVWEYTIWSDGHTWTYVDGQEPTCTETGWWSYSYCTVCDYIRNYEERSPVGHSYRADTCSACGFVNTAFEKVNVPGLTTNLMTVTPAERVPYNAQSANIVTQHGEIADKSTVQTFHFTAALDGRYRVWLNEVYSGYYLKVYIYNSLDERVTYDSSVYNKEGFYLDLAAGDYRVEVSYGSGLTTFNINFGHAKATADISNYDIINDKMEFERQTIKYTFVPTVSGLYSFYLGEMTGNAEMSMAMYNRLNERIKYGSYLGNGEGLKVELTAGETYTLHIENAYGYLTDYKLNIGKQTATVDLAGYNAVSDQITFDGQVNYYTFVATNSECRIEVKGIPTDKYVTLNIYNHLGERLKYDNYCYSGDGFNMTDLVVGNTYRVAIGYAHISVPYTLHLHNAKAAVNVNSDMAVTDSVEYEDQTNVYSFTVDRDGNHKVMLLINSYESSACLSISIYDANGNRVKYDSTVYDGNYFDMGQLTAGATYTIYVNEYSGAVNYTLSIQE